ncbi:hypothetical protein, partial [Brucella rhizosphaerae]|uniref:hypothetical protein n=1 Tax=Brucella rhizosphaerae TaxID=571254 RepID=UPI001267EA2C
MRDRKVTPDMVPVIKLARNKNIPYSWITGYYAGLNFGRIADVTKCPTQNCNLAIRRVIRLIDEMNIHASD